MADHAPLLDQDGRPVVAVVASRLADRLAPGLSVEVAERLLQSPRLGRRAQDWAATGRDDALAGLSDVDRALAEAGVAGLHRAATLAGAVWHADRVRGLVLTRDLQGFIETHGAAARDAALRHAALCPGLPDGGVALDDAVPSSGRACLGAWLDALPAPAAAFLRLSLPHGAEAVPDDTHRAHGPAILRAVAVHPGVAEDA